MSIIPGAAVVVDEVSMKAAIKVLLEDFDRKQNIIQQLHNDSSKERYNNQEGGTHICCVLDLCPRSN